MEERNMNRYDFDSSYAQRGLTLNQYVSRTFGWMFVGLMITFLLAAALAMTGAVIYLFVNPYIPMVLLIAEVAVVFIMSAGILKRPVGVTRMRVTPTGCCSRSTPSSMVWCSLRTL